MTRTFTIAIVVFFGVVAALGQTAGITDAEYAFVTSLYSTGAQAVVENTTASFSDDALPQDKLLRKLKGLKPETVADFTSKNAGPYRFEGRMQDGGRVRLIDRQTILDVIYKPQYRYDGWKMFHRRYGTEWEFARYHELALMQKELRHSRIRPIRLKRAATADTSFMNAEETVGGWYESLSYGGTTSDSSIRIVQPRH